MSESLDLDAIEKELAEIDTTMSGWDDRLADWNIAYAEALIAEVRRLRGIWAYIDSATFHELIGLASDGESYTYSNDDEAFRQAIRDFLLQGARRPV